MCLLCPRHFVTNMTLEVEKYISLLIWRVFIDSDVLFAGSSFPNINSASNVILQIDEVVLIKVVAREQVIAEVSRNLGEKMPEALPIFTRIVRRCIQVIPDPSPQDVEGLSPQAAWKDVPILAAAINARCHYLIN